MIQPSPTALEGSVTTLEDYSESTFPANSAILCRNTAPLVSFAFSLLRRNIGCTILGRDIGVGLIKLVESQRATDMDQLETSLIRQRAQELTKAKTESAASAISDKFNCLNIFVREFRAGAISALTDKIRSLFSAETRGGLVTLATGHKAKGLEWEKVFILDTALCPSPWATQPWQRKQERHIFYVMVTRAKLDLVFIESNKWKQTQQEQQNDN